VWHSWLVFPIGSILDRESSYAAFTHSGLPNLMAGRRTREAIQYCDRAKSVTPANQRVGKRIFVESLRQLIALPPVR
jgi:hypothetical protein